MTDAALTLGLQRGASLVLSCLGFLTVVPAKAQWFVAHHDWNDPFLYKQRQILRGKGKVEAWEGHQPIVTAAVDKQLCQDLDEVLMALPALRPRLSGEQVWHWAQLAILSAPDITFSTLGSFLWNDSTKLTSGFQDYKQMPIVHAHGQDLSFVLFLSPSLITMNTLLSVLLR